MNERHEESTGFSGEAAHGRGEHARNGEDRRADGGGLFGYQGPERRSGKNRRTTA
jgi:hypothetical protein